MTLHCVALLLHICINLTFLLFFSYFGRLFQDAVLSIVYYTSSPSVYRSMCIDHALSHGLPCFVLLSFHPKSSLLI